MPKPGDELVPGYHLRKFLGEGQFGQVWRATGPGETDVALKLLNLQRKQGLKELHAIQQVKSVRHRTLAEITALWLLDEEGNVCVRKTSRPMSTWWTPLTAFRSTQPVRWI